jgi:hypothetical protein
MENAVEKAIRILGGSLQATLKTGIHPTTLWKWAQAGRIKDGARAVLVSRATDGEVSVEELVGAEPVGNGDEPPKGKRFPVGGRSSATYQASSLSPTAEPDPVPAAVGWR